MVETDVTRKRKKERKANEIRRVQRFYDIFFFFPQLNGEIYWPMNEEEILNIGCFTIVLKRRTNHVSYVQRVISVYNTRKKLEKTVVHMQFVTWPSK